MIIRINSASVQVHGSLTVVQICERFFLVFVDHNAKERDMTDKIFTVAYPFEALDLSSESLKHRS